MQLSPCPLAAYDHSMRLDGSVTDLSPRAKPRGRTCRIFAFKVLPCLARCKASVPRSVTVCLVRQGAAPNTPSFPRTGEAELVADHGVILVAHARQRIEAEHIKDPVLQAVVAHVDADHLTENGEVRLARQLQDLGKLAFKVGGRLCHAGTIDCLALDLLYPRQFEFIHVT